MTTPPPAPELNRVPGWAPPVLFGLLTLIAFRGYLLAPQGSMLLGGDTIAAGVMMRSFFVDQYHALGRLPLWNPYLYGGVPTIEGGSGDILYPVSFALHMMLPMVQALAWKLILHVFLAGFCMYGCVRAFGVSRLVACFAGVAWMLSANLVSLVLGGQDGKMYVITLFPAALGLLLSALESGSWIRFVWLGAVAGLILVAHPQLAFYAWAALGGYAGVWLVLRWKDGMRFLLPRVGGGVLSLILALAISAIVLLPMYRYLREVSPRAGPGLRFEQAASYALNPEEVVNFVVPDFSGVDETYWGRNPLKHNSEYGGVVVFALGLAALVGLKGDRRRIGLGIMAAVALIYAVGATTPVFKLMYLTLPGLRNFRAPSLATFLALTAFGILTALLLERILRNRDAPELRPAFWLLGALGVGSLVLAILVGAMGSRALGAWVGLFGPTPRLPVLDTHTASIALGAVFTALWCGLSWLALAAWQRGWINAVALVAILTAVTALDLLRVDSRYIRIAPYEQFFPSDAGFEDLRRQLQPGERVLAFPGVLQGGGPEGGFLATYRIPEVFGYHANQLRWYDQLTRRDQRDAARTTQEINAYWLGFLQSPALRALAARIALLPGRVNLPGYDPIGSNEQLAIYQHVTALPGASVVPAVQVEPDSTKLIDRLWDPTFDPAKIALVAAPVPQIGAGGGTGEAAIVLDGADTVAVDLSTSGPALLLVSRTFHPSWRATLDGQAIPTVRTNHALLGIPVTAAGKHQVTLAYRPTIVARSKLVSILGWVVVLIGTVLAGAQAIRRRPIRA